MSKTEDTGSWTGARNCTRETKSSTCCLPLLFCTSLSRRRMQIRGHCINAPCQQHIVFGLQRKSPYVRFSGSQLLWWRPAQTGPNEKHRANTKDSLTPPIVHLWIVKCVYEFTAVVHVNRLKNNNRCTGPLWKLFKRVAYGKKKKKKNLPKTIMDSINGRVCFLHQAVRFCKHDSVATKILLFLLFLTVRTVAGGHAGGDDWPNLHGACAAQWGGGGGGVGFICRPNKWADL